MSDPRPAPVYCSFCGREKKEGQTFIEGVESKATICGYCLALANKALKKPPHRGPKAERTPVVPLLVVKAVKT